MTSHFVRKVQSFNAVAFFVLIFVPLAALRADAQPQTVRQASTASERGAFSQKKASPAGSETLSFRRAVLYDSGAFGASSVAVGDVNGDGKPDLIVANNWNCNSGSCATNGTVGVLLGNGDGTFRQVVSYNSGGQYAVSVAVADVNGDGKLDVIVANECPLDGCGQTGSGVVSVLLGNGDGTLQPAVPYSVSGATPVQPQTVMIADVNGDGKPDLVTVLFGSQVNVMMGNGDGTFQPAVLYGIGCCNRSSLTIADVNGDGKPDLLLVFALCIGCQTSPGQVGVMLNNGDGTFKPEVLYESGGDVPISVQARDVNGDGKPDLVVGNSCSVWSDGFCSGVGSVSVLFGNGDGTFQGAVSYDSAELSNLSAVIADLDGDGNPDLVAAGCPSTNGSGPVFCGGPSDGSLAALISNGNGTFQSELLFDAGGVWPTSIAVSDLDGDGKTDVVMSIAYGYVPGGADGAVSVLLNGVGSSPFPTTTSLASSHNPCVKPCPVTFTAVVTSSGGTPTGTVSFFDGSSSLGSATLSGGLASLATGGFHHGDHSITAAYQGSTDFAPSTSPVLDQVVYEQTLATTITLTTSGSPIFVGQSVTFTAQVNSNVGGGPPNGEIITFSESKVGVIGSVPLAGGGASLTTSALTAGKHIIKASYNGDGVYGNSFDLVTEIVDKNSTTTTLISSSNPATLGEPITFTVTVTSSGPSTPTGSVRLPKIGTLTLSGGMATITKSNLKVGTHAITAEYKGDADSAGSDSPVLEQVVNPD